MFNIPDIPVNRALTVEYVRCLIERDTLKIYYVQRALVGKKFIGRLTLACLEQCY